MKKYSIQFSIEEIGFEGEILEINACKTFYVTEKFYNEFVKSCEDKLKLKEG